MPSVQKISPCLWFDDQAEAAVDFYTSIFPNSRISGQTRYTEAGHEFHGRPPGSVMTIAFELDGAPFTALNGGPAFTFNEAVSFQVMCADQAEIDHYWNRLSAGGPERAQQCGWLKDRFGVSWQVVPRVLVDMLADADARKAHKAMRATLGMTKLDIAALERAVAA